jgi:hypothetical protein
MRLEAFLGVKTNAATVAVNFLATNGVKKCA